MFASASASMFVAIVAILGIIAIVCIFLVLERRNKPPVPPPKPIERKPLDPVIPCDLESYPLEVKEEVVEPEPPPEDRTTEPEEPDEISLSFLRSLHNPDLRDRLINTRYEEICSEVLGATKGPTGHWETLDGGLILGPRFDDITPEVKDLLQDKQFTEARKLVYDNAILEE